VGPEFRVNDVTLGFQYEPAVAADADGDFIVAWSSDYVDGSSTAVMVRRYDRAGHRIGGELQVNTFTPGYQIQPAVGVHPSGSFVVTWVSDQIGAEHDIFAQRFDAAGARVGGEFQVNTYTPNQQRGPEVAVGAGGEFVILWSSYGYGADTHVAGQRFDAAGNRVGGEFRVTDDTAYHRLSAAAARPGGGFVVAWETYPEAVDPSSGIVARLFDAAGAPVAAEFPVNTHTANSQTDADLAIDAAGNFVVVWEGWAQDDAPNADPGIFGQRFDSAGGRLGGEFRVNTFTTGPQDRPSVAREPGGAFVVTWRSGQDLDLTEVLGQRFSPSGTPIGPEFLVNTFTTFEQEQGVVAALGGAEFVVAWTSYGQDGFGPGVYAQRFSDVIFRDGFED
jgi:hypothetical protein